VRTVLMIEVDGDAEAAAGRVAELAGDVVVWGEVDPTAAALLVVERDLLAA
jgi:hypothetical protein